MASGHNQFTQKSSLLQLFCSHVLVGDGCWNWTARLDKDGYGSIKHNHKVLRAHRVSWQLFRGEIPEGMYACHSCDNPRCVKPSHLFLGTPADNMQDRDRKGRHRCGIGRAKLDIAQVREIRAAKESQVKLAKMYGVHQSTISDIKNRVHWGNCE